MPFYTTFEPSFDYAFPTQPRYTYSPFYAEPTHHYPFHTRTPTPTPTRQPIYESDSGLDDEEQAVLAQLAAIRQKREQLKATQAREAARAAKAQAQREAMIKAELAQALVREQEKKRKQEEERKREEERERRAVFARAMEQANVQREKERLAQAEGRKRQQNEAIKSDSPSHVDINNILSALFGINLAPSDEEEEGESEHEEAEVSVPILSPQCTSAACCKSDKSTTTDNEAVVKSQLAQAIARKEEIEQEQERKRKQDEEKRKEQEEERKQQDDVRRRALSQAMEKKAQREKERLARAQAKNRQPTHNEGLQNLLNAFFGVNPPTSDDSEQSDVESEASEAPRPQRRAAPVKSTNAPAPKAPAAPQPEATAFTATPEPSETLSPAFTILRDMDTQLAQLKSSFTFPSHLSFAHSTPNGQTPPLLFNRTNAPYHAQTNALLQLLLQADTVISEGQPEVRKARKDMVKKVEAEIRKMEEKRDEIWEEVRIRRESGEEAEPDEDEERSWSDCSSVVKKQ
ncbi:hypothetical protein L202_06015 [Cryptococcus amylolentus CBS 6039]|uniref:BAG domain-containing protein n=1 Tax=Cryptococcus amylolentus CBS 6039 TaxID=1295533 RepID=A0A1E3HIB8_9TREE|nr:hypothetical protein L202_06015 [Cryptococcus amylolentus CBS 6039]ODN76074.1 hypothetical protein L202_06015 [Cryptococcus amylolentus CBS 6039]